jgi:hypothetical protein
MSIPTKEQASTFLAPLRGKLATLLLHDVQAKMELSRFILGCARLHSVDTTVLDTDAFYCTNIDRLADGDAKAMKGELALFLPEQDFEVISLLPLVSSRRELLVIDDLNSIYSLASNGRKSHQLTILMKLLSYNAKMNQSWAIATAYRQGPNEKEEKVDQRSLIALGDVLVDTYFQDGSLRLKGEFGGGQWPDDGLEI